MPPPNITINYHGSSQIDYLNTTTMSPSQVINDVQTRLSSTQTHTNRNLTLHALYDWYRFNFTTLPSPTTPNDILISQTLKLRALTFLHYNTSANFSPDIRINYARRAQLVAAELIVGFGMTGESYQRGMVNFYLARALVTLGEVGLLPGDEGDGDGDGDGERDGEKDTDKEDGDGAGTGQEGRPKGVTQ